MKLNEFQKDAIREIISIGAGNATIGISKAVKKEVDIEIPHIEICPIEEVIEKIGDPEMHAIVVYVRFMNGLQGRVVILFPEEDAIKFDNIISRKNKRAVKISMNSIRTVSSLGSIIASNSLKAISEFLSRRILITEPDIAYDMLGAILQQILVEISQYSKNVLFSKTSIFISSEKINCMQIFFFEPEAMEYLLKVIEEKI